MAAQSGAPPLTLAEVDRVFSRVRALGVEWQRTRFHTYRKELALHVNPTRAFLNAYRSNDQRRRLIFEAGSQMMQLVMAERVWDLLDPRLLRSTLKVIFDGRPIDPSTDDRPRNLLLELLAASLLSERFAVALTASDEDLRLQHDVLGTGAVECKRPLNQRNLLPNLNEIGDQLRARAGSRFGVAVVGGDRIASTASHAFEAESAQEAYSGVKGRCTEIAVEVAKLSQRARCTVSPPAVRALVVVTGSVLVRTPRQILQPVVSVVEIPIGEGFGDGFLRAFESGRGAALSDMLISHERSQRPTPEHEPKGPS